MTFDLFATQLKNWYLLFTIHFCWALKISRAVLWLFVWQTQWLTPTGRCSRRHRRSAFSELMRRLLPPQTATCADLSRQNHRHRLWTRWRPVPTVRWTCPPPRCQICLLLHLLLHGNICRIQWGGCGTRTRDWFLPRLSDVSDGYWKKLPILCRI